MARRKPATIVLPAPPDPLYTAHGNLVIKIQPHPSFRWSKRNELIYELAVIEPLKGKGRADSSSSIGIYAVYIDGKGQRPAFGPGPQAGEDPFDSVKTYTGGEYYFPLVLRWMKDYDDAKQRSRIITQKDIDAARAFYPEKWREILAAEANVREGFLKRAHEAIAEGRVDLPGAHEPTLFGVRENKLAKLTMLGLGAIAGIVLLKTKKG